MARERRWHTDQYRIRIGKVRHISGCREAASTNGLLHGGSGDVLDEALATVDLGNPRCVNIRTYDTKASAYSRQGERDTHIPKANNPDSCRPVMKFTNQTFKVEDHSL
jgi:hypothetical protein